MVIVILWSGILILICGCSIKKTLPVLFPEKRPAHSEKQGSTEALSPPAQPTQAPRPANPATEKTDPRMLAAASLVEQGKTYLDNGQPDQALNILERALSIDPGSGKTYYYMAEAWLMKKNKRQAVEFNRLAGMYLSDDHQWADRMADQQKRIDNLP